MRQIEINNRSKLIPVCWNELKPSQLLVFIKVFYLKSDTIYTTATTKFGQKKVISTNGDKLLKAQILILWSLIGIKWRLFRHFTKEQVHDLLYVLKLTDFLFYTDNLTKNLYPYLRNHVWDKKLIGPDDNFKNIRAKEYTFAELSYRKYKETNEIKYLDLFIAILYRYKRAEDEIISQGWDGDLREKFNNKTVEIRLKQVKKIPIGKKIAVLLWYEGCMRAIKHEFKELYNHSSAVSGRSVKVQSFDDLIMEYAGGKFGDYNQTSDAYLRDLLKAICKEIQNKNARAEMAEHSKAEKI